MPAKSAATALRASRALEADAMRMLSKMDDSACPKAERRRLDAAAGRCYSRIADLDRVIIETRGTAEDGLAKVQMAFEVAEHDHAEELWFALLRSGLDDLAADRGQHPGNID